MSARSSAVLRKRSEPLAGEIQLLEMIGGGCMVAEAARELVPAISPYTAHDRLRRLKFLTGLHTVPGLVAWGLRERLFEYGCTGFQEFDETKTRLVQFLARDMDENQVRRKMFLSEGQFDGHLRRARLAVGATHRAHLVAIYWTQGWIV